MFSIGKLLGRDEKFFDLLEASAQQADRSVHQLVDLLGKLQQKGVSHDLTEFAASRREDKRITQELTEELSSSFITPLEREDIQALASALYKIPKTVEKIEAHGVTSIERLAENRIILGDPAICIEQILRFQRTLSATYLICRFSVPGIPRDICKKSLDLFTREVMPVIRRSQGATAPISMDG